MVQITIYDGVGELCLHQQFLQSGTIFKGCNIRSVIIPIKVTNFNDIPFSGIIGGSSSTSSSTILYVAISIGSLIGLFLLRYGYQYLKVHYKLFEINDNSNNDENIDEYMPKPPPTPPAPKSKPPNEEKQQKSSCCTYLFLYCLCGPLFIGFLILRRIYRHFKQ